MNYHNHLFWKAGKYRTNIQKSFKTTQSVWDSGASFWLTPFHADFVDDVEYESDVKALSYVNKVIGFGTALHKFIATNHDLLCLPSLSYNFPSADICLFSPQACHQLYGGSSELIKM